VEIVDTNTFGRFGTKYCGGITVRGLVTLKVFLNDKYDRVKDGAY